MRRAARVDVNQAAIVDALRKVGAHVEVIGKPVDLLVCFRGQTSLMECKDGAKTPGNRPLTPAQNDFLATWPGKLDVVLSPESALKALGIF